MLPCKRLPQAREAHTAILSEKLQLERETQSAKLNASLLQGEVRNHLRLVVTTLILQTLLHLKWIISFGVNKRCLSMF
jgi:hypothetical protein